MIKYEMIVYTKMMNTDRNVLMKKKALSYFLYRFPMKALTLRMAYNETRAETPSAASKVAFGKYWLKIKL